MSESPLLMLVPSDVLRFDLPLGGGGGGGGGPVTAALTLRNPSLTRRVAFKVKTTAPSSYTVRPSQGFLAPGEAAAVEVALQKGADGRRITPSALAAAPVSPPADWRRHKFKALSQYSSRLHIY